MKRVISSCLAVAISLVAVIAGSGSNADAQSAGLVSSVLMKMERNHKDLRSLRARIYLENYNAQLREKDSRSGTVLYVPTASRNANVRIDWQSPQKEMLTVFNGQYLACRDRLKQCLVGNKKNVSNKNGGILELLSMSPAQMKASYEPLQPLGEDNLGGGVTATHLKLVPKSGSSFKYAEIWVDGSGMLVQTKIVERNDDATTMRLTNVEKNVTISTDEFRVKPDPTFRIVKG